MSFYKLQFRDLIADTLDEIGLYSEDATNLLLGTAAQESHFGTYLRQLKSGPALGVFQMEPNTYKDIWNRYITYKQDLHIKIKDAIEAPLTPSCDDMVWNLKLAIIMARVHYLRVKESLPTEISGYAKYWKKYYNTYLGAGTEEEFIRNYKEFVL